MNFDNQQLRFPVKWRYRIIVEKSAAVVALPEIIAILRRHDITATPEPGHDSPGGKYERYYVEAVFRSREMMETLSAELAGIAGVKFIL